MIYCTPNSRGIEEQKTAFLGLTFPVFHYNFEMAAGFFKNKNQPN
jgi:hypothetical protein